MSFATITGMHNIAVNPLFKTLNFRFRYQTAIAILKMNDGFRLAVVHFANQNFSFRHIGVIHVRIIQHYVEWGVNVIQVSLVARWRFATRLTGWSGIEDSS